MAMASAKDKLAELKRVVERESGALRAIATTISDHADDAALLTDSERQILRGWARQIKESSEILTKAVNDSDASALARLATLAGAGAIFFAGSLLGGIGEAVGHDTTEAVRERLSSQAADVQDCTADVERLATEIGTHYDETGLTVEAEVEVTAHDSLRLADEAERPSVEYTDDVTVEGEGQTSINDEFDPAEIATEPPSAYQEGYGVGYGGQLDEVAQRERCTPPPDYATGSGGVFILWHNWADATQAQLERARQTNLGREGGRAVVLGGAMAHLIDTDTGCEWGWTGHPNIAPGADQKLAAIFGEPVWQGGTPPTFVPVQEDAP